MAGHRANSVIEGKGYSIAGSNPAHYFLTLTAGNALDSKSMRTIRPELTGIASMTMLESAS